MLAMEQNLPAAQVEQLKAFVQLLQANTDLLHSPQLEFFKDYLIGCAPID